MTRIAAVVLSLLCIAELDAWAQDPPPDRFASLLERTQSRLQERRKLYDQQFNIQYAKNNEQPRRNSLDVFTPRKARNPTPVVIFVHGGAWQFGDKRLTNKKQSWLTKNEIALVSANYRFVPDVDVADQAADVAAAISWVRKNAKQYNIDRNKIFLMGHSAGAHLVALVATDPSYLEKEKMKPADLAGVIPVDGGGLDVSLQIELAESPSNVRTYKKVFGEDVEKQQLASPIFHLKSGHQFPRFLVAHVANRLTTRKQADRFIEKLISVGGNGETYSADGKTHLTINRDLSTAGDETATRIIEFIQSDSSNTKTDHEAELKKIVLNKSGGFAGLQLDYSIDSHGVVMESNNKKRRLSNSELKSLKKLVANTDWKGIPKQALNGKEVADDFLWKIRVETNAKVFEYEINELKLRRYPPLAQLTRFIK